MNSKKMTNINIYKASLIFMITLCVAANPKYNRGESPPDYPSAGNLDKIGDNAYPSNPMNDRAKGYLLKGKVKNGIGNYGNYIDWDFHPAGLWGEYTYLPTVGLMAGVPGHAYSSKFSWTDCSETYLSESLQGTNVLWCSSDAYEEWQPGTEDVFVDVVFDVEGDNGSLGSRKLSTESVDGVNQWGYDNEQGFVFICTSSIYDDPNSSAAMMGLVYPWAKRPALSERLEEFDLYDYGDDQEEWTEDDNYVYYGANFAESYFSNYGGSYASDWQATTKARENTHNIDVNAGDIFGQTEFTDENDTNPLLAHSNFKSTWPIKYNLETGSYDSYWPGWFAKDYYGDDPTSWPSQGIEDCNGTRKDKDCWVESSDRHISDSDVYIEFDDRWAHRGNQVDNNVYRQSGYPMGLKVMSMAHSYGVAYAEDIMFVTVSVRNESGSWYDEDGTYHSAMVMPDGTQLNAGNGFNYKELFLGFYMDADVLTATIDGSFGVHTNADDYMEYYWERFEVNGEEMLISMAIIGDYDGNSNGVTGYSMKDEQNAGSNFGLVAVQLLDSPAATVNVDLNQDGIDDILIGEPLKMTDWHWFDWYNRPGVVDRESNSNCCAGYTASRPQAANKELIQLKVMSGDTTNLTEDEKAWFFHTPYPDTDLDALLNPHFDSLDGLEEEPVFSQGQEGLDCVLEMASGPFDIDVGEEVPFSFCIIFGENKEDLIKNARFAQVMYNSNYQGFTAPLIPTLTAESDVNKVKLSWDTSAKYSKDVVTGYSDFEGYKIYKSIDGGRAWGGPEDKIYDQDGIHVGWEPIAQFDLSAEEDSLFCVKGLNQQKVSATGIYSSWEDCVEGEEVATNCCYQDRIRGISISGNDPNAPWFSLGENTGLESIYNSETGRYEFTDNNVIDGIEYTYAITAYDMGVSGAQVDANAFSDNDTFYTLDTLYLANPDKWAAPFGYKSIENPRGAIEQDKNFVNVVSGARVTTNLNNVMVVPNPYVAHSEYNETEYLRKIRFNNLTPKCIIKIYTVSGELVNTIEHDSEDEGYAAWDLRSMNNQEVAPGLYLFTVESDGVKDFIGKFAVIR
ncbi:MAG: hypothetical protein HOA66_08980 [Candidatus Marinimicrobia bacterium]|nr:hypothetical protein [Candidatus Neomarinimicrobiota bacterium]